MIKKWEYLDIGTRKGSPLTSDNGYYKTVPVEQLDELGAQGWEVVWVDDRLTRVLLKREYISQPAFRGVGEAMPPAPEPMPAEYIDEGKPIRRKR